jgi:hypothetical protein
METAKFRYIPVSLTAVTLLAGLLVFVLLGAGTPLFQVFLGDDSRTWIPIAGLDAFPSDEYYSIEALTTVIHAGEIPLTQDQAADILPQWEKKRFTSLGTAAAFSLFFEDIRHALLSSLFITSVAYFLVPIIGFWLLTGNPLSGVLPAILFFLWPNMWSVMSKADPWLVDGRILNVPSFVVQEIRDVLRYIYDIRKPEYISQTFRFPFPNIGFLHLSLFYFGLMFVFLKAAPFRILFLMFAAYLVIFSYQPVLVVSCFLILSMFCVSLFEKNRASSAVYLFLGCSVLLYLLLSGYRESAISDVQSHAVVGHLIGESGGGSLRDVSFRDILGIFINRYSISGVVCAALVWRNRVLRVFVLGALWGCLFIKASGLFEILPSTYGRRLERRGIDPLWMLTIGISLWYGWKRALESFRMEIPRRAFRSVGILLVGCLYAFPAVSFWNYSSNAEISERFSIANSQWDMITWIGQNVSDADTVVAGNWLDVHYVRMFSGKHTSFATIMNTGRPSDIEMGLYIASLKALGFSRDYVIDQFRRSAEAYEQYRHDYERYRQEFGGAPHPVTFKGDEALFNTAWLYGAILRPVWFPEAMGVAKLDGPGRISEPFLEVVSGLYDDRQQAIDILPSGGSAYFVLRTSEIGSTENALWRECPMTFENQSYKIFRC